MPFDRILRSYDPHGQWTLVEGETGWNNTTRFVEKDGRRRVLRIYETHRDEDKIRFEHEALLALSRCSLPFDVPKPELTQDGKTYVRLEDGTGRYACLFAFTEGCRPNGQDPVTALAIGEAVGRLTRELSCVQVGLPSAYFPYYEMDKAHPSCTPAGIAAFCGSPSPAFEDLASELAVLQDALARFHVYLPKLRALPHQYIHGDVNDSNLLVASNDPHRVTAVLDFEFCTRDVRAMEPAVVLSGMLHDEPAQRAIAAFLEGYGRFVKFAPEEADAIPLLMKLRKLDVFVHFLGRFLDGVDNADVLREQIPSAAEGLARLQEYEAVILALCRLHLC